MRLNPEIKIRQKREAEYKSAGNIYIPEASFFWQTLLKTFRRSPKVSY